MNQQPPVRKMPHRSLRALLPALFVALLHVTSVLPPATALQAGDTEWVDYVNPLIDTHKSRWIFFSSACRPYGMVNLSPDTKVGGDWMHGYIYGEEMIRCFSHIHGWQLYGIPVMPAVGPVDAAAGLEGMASPFCHSKEVAKAGYHKVVLDRYGITAELTSTDRVGMHRYTFPGAPDAQIAFHLGATLMAGMDASEIRQISPTEVAGYAVMSATVRRPKPFKVYFVAQVDRPMDAFETFDYPPVADADASANNAEKKGGSLRFHLEGQTTVLMKVAISYVSEANARLNLQSELPHWDFDSVVQESRDAWNQMLGRIAVQGGTREQRIKFYTDLWHALLGRRMVSDVDGRYADNTGPETRIRQVRLGSDGNPLFPHYNFDSLWGSHWSLNILWSFAYPEIMDGFCNTMVDMYQNGGLIPRGPSGGNYTYVMNGDPATPFFAAAIQKGITNFDVERAYEGMWKNAFPGGIRERAGYEHVENPSSGGIRYYVERGYVPEGIPGTGWHANGAGMTLEYAYQDWCLGQVARKLGRADDAALMEKRSRNFRNVWNPDSGWVHPRTLDGAWLAGFEPVGPKGSFNTKGFTESNSAVYSYFVPHAMPELIELMGGPAHFAARLNLQFEIATPDNFVVAHGEHGGVWVDYDNQPGTAMAHLFNFAGRPDLTQKWVRQVKDLAFGDVTPLGGYNGDEDQGQMGALGVLMALGLFDVTGGASMEPTYQLTTPIFDQARIKLHPDYFPGGTFVIRANRTQASDTYIQSAHLNGAELHNFWILHEALAKGGVLVFEVGPARSNWAAQSAPLP